MKKENAIIIVETLVNLFIWNSNNNFSIENLDKGRTKIIPEDQTYMIHIILNKAETNEFFEHKRVKRVRGNDYIIVPEKPENSRKVTDK